MVDECYNVALNAYVILANSKYFKEDLKEVGVARDEVILSSFTIPLSAT